MNDAIKRLKAWAHWKGIEYEKEGNLNPDREEFLLDIEHLVEAVEEARYVITGWKNLTDTEIYKHPWNGTTREWLRKYSPNETSEA